MCGDIFEIIHVRLNLPGLPNCYTEKDYSNQAISKLATARKNTVHGVTQFALRSTFFPNYN